MLLSIQFQIKNKQTWKNFKILEMKRICNALMMITGVIETFAICRLYRFVWP